MTDRQGLGDKSQVYGVEKARFSNFYMINTPVAGVFIA
jgi:hypothetical protein